MQTKLRHKAKKDFHVGKVFFAQNAWNDIWNWCVYWHFTPWPQFHPQIDRLGSKKAKLTTLSFLGIVRKNIWYFPNIYKQIVFFDHMGWVTILFSKKNSYIILCIYYKTSKLSFRALAGRVSCEFSIFGPQMVDFWRLAGSKSKMPV